MSFFQKQEQKNDYEKMGIKSFKVMKSKGKWVFERNGDIYDFAPAQLTSASLNPIVIGTDAIINIACKTKGIVDYEGGFVLLVNDNYFPMCDVRIEYIEPFYDGWVYDVLSENLQGLMPSQKTWICPYIKFYYSEPPLKLYLKMISIAEYGAPI